MDSLHCLSICLSLFGHHYAEKCVDGAFADRCCPQAAVELSSITSLEEADQLRLVIQAHQQLTGSAVAQRILEDWEEQRERFVKVIPTDYKRALERLAQEEAAVPEPVLVQRQG